jgi:tetratricopeptide (TPR) repeat protein
MRFFPSVQFAPALAGAFFCALLNGCATPQVSQLHDGTRSVAQSADIASTPFFAQKEYECGPASLAMVMSAAGVPVRPEALVEQVYLPARKGSLQVEMLAATRQRGLLAYPLQPSVQALLQEVAAGHPVLVLQNLSLPLVPVWHYAVVIGYDLERNTVTLHSGETARLEMSLFTFERTWSRGNYWAMLALPAGTLPVSADAATLARAAASLEEQHPDAALRVYSAAVQRWPNDAALHLGLGNSAYVLNDVSAALKAYQMAATLQPTYADAWNNLAQTQLDLGNRPAAAEAIAQAINLGGTRLANYKVLQAQIQNRIAR